MDDPPFRAGFHGRLTWPEAPPAANPGPIMVPSAAFSHKKKEPARRGAPGFDDALLVYELLVMHASRPPDGGWQDRPSGRMMTAGPSINKLNGRSIYRIL